MPDQMKILRLKNQTTDATVLNSFSLPSDNKGNFDIYLCSCQWGHLHMLDEIGSYSLETFVESSKMKINEPKKQGTDAVLEQLIKRSKKGAKIKVTC